MARASDQPLNDDMLNVLVGHRWQTRTPNLKSLLTSWAHDSFHFSLHLFRMEWAVKGLNGDRGWLIEKDQMDPKSLKTLVLLQAKNSCDSAALGLSLLLTNTSGRRQYMQPSYYTKAQCEVHFWLGVVTIENSHSLASQFHYPVE